MNEITLAWQSTPRLWQAYRKDQCFCEDCSHKATVGHGGTEFAAILDLVEKEMEAKDAAWAVRPHSYKGHDENR